MKPSRAQVLASPPVAAGFALAGIPSEGVERERAADRVREVAAGLQPLGLVWEASRLTGAAAAGNGGGVEPE